MTQKFEWQTEAKKEWEAAPAVVQETAASRHRYWLMGSFVIVLLGAALVVGQRQMNRRLAQAEIAITEDVLSSHELVLTAVSNQDIDLLRPLLSGREPDWTDVQQQLVAEGSFLGRSAFGLEAAAGKAEEVEVQLSADLTEAEVTFTWPYVAALAGGVTETVRLQQTAVYRRGDQRWLYSPPVSGWEGEWRSYTGERLTLWYPQREAAWVQRLAPDLDGILVEACRTLVDLDCPPPPAFQVEVRLVHDPRLLQAPPGPAFVGVSSVSNGTLRFDLPSLTLLGQPVDEAGYQAMGRGYALRLLPIVIAHLVDYQCCSQPLFFQALLDTQMQTLGLPSSLAAPNEVIYLEEFPFDMVNWSMKFDRLWNLPLDQAARSDRDWAVFFMELIRQETAVSPTRLQRFLSRSDSPTAWMTTASFDLQATWMRRIFLADIDDATPLPQQDTLFLCGNHLYRYDWQTFTYAPEESQPLVAYGRQGISVLGDTILLQGITGADAPLWQTIRWWPDGGEVLFSRPADPDRVYQTRLDASGRHLLVSITTAESPERPYYGMLDLHGCRGDCRLSPLPGSFAEEQVAWSPSGDQYVFTEPNFFIFTDTQGNEFASNLTLAHLSEPSIHFLGYGRNPFWLDKDTFGYVGSVGGADVGEAIFIETVSDLQPYGQSAEMVLETADLLTAIPEAARPPTLTINQVLPHPTDPDLILVGAATKDLPVLNNAQNRHLFVVHWETAEASLLLTTGEEQVFGRLRSEYFSPDGRWVAFHGVNVETHQVELIQFNLETGNKQTTHLGNFAAVGSIFDWSADGAWLVHVAESGLYLLSPKAAVQRRVPHSQSFCRGVAWVE